MRIWFFYRKGKGVIVIPRLVMCNNHPTQEAQDDLAEVIVNHMAFSHIVDTDMTLFEFIPLNGVVN